MTDPLVIYHKNCYDGFTAAWAAFRTFGQDAEYLPMGYDDNFSEYKPWTDRVQGRPIYVLDFSFDRLVMEKVDKIAGLFVVLDHHKTARDACRDLECCTFNMDKSGARLAWEYFQPTQDVPLIVQYVEDRDLWNWNLDHSREINAGIRSYEFDFDQWNSFYYRPDHYFSHRGGNGGLYRGELYSEGRAILRNQDRVVDQICEHAKSVVVGLEYGDITLPSVNSSVHQSEIGNQLAEEHGAALIWYVGSDKEVKCSLRSTDEGPDVSEIAEYHGGGGHENAAGFTASEHLKRKLV